MPNSSRQRPQVLLVGAGAVGQIYGYYLAQAGAEVTFYVKEKHADTVRAGFRLYRIPSFRLSGKGELRDPVQFDTFRVVTRLEEVSGTQWDQVYLCMSSPALRSGWFPEFAGALNPTAIVVMLQDGLEDRAYVAAYVPEARLVCGSIGFSSYSAPLPGETVSNGPGTAYWLPSAAATFSGPAEPTDSVVALVRRGGFPGQRVPDARAAAAVTAAIGRTIVAALPIAGWSFSGLSRDRSLLRTTSAAAQQALAVAERTVGARPGAARLLVRPFFLRLALRLIPVFAPFRIESFFRYHFTKVGDQMLEGMEICARLAREHGLPADALETLLEQRRAIPGE